MPESGIEVTLSIKWALNGVFRLNLMSNIGRIFYFWMILESFDILSLVCHCTRMVLLVFNHIFVYRNRYSGVFYFHVSLDFPISFISGGGLGDGILI